jgi:predicted dehydrogenase
MNAIRRREFVLASTVASVAASTGRSMTANEHVKIGVIGLGNQGKAHLKSYLDIKNVEVAYICDVDEKRLNDGSKIAPSTTAVTDLRRILDDKSIDAISIATPDHWHTPATLLALAAGKHVYVEKPCSHNVREGRMLVDAVARSGLLVQHGTQARSSPFIQAAIKLLRDGVIGTVEIARAWNVQYRPSIGREKPSESPSGFDYDTWIGPAPLVPFQSNRHHYNWHWWYDFGTGDAGNDGVHEIDIARWGLGVQTHPSQVAAIGGKYVHDDDQQFPDTITAAYEYPGDGSVGQRRQLTFEMRLWSRYHPQKIDNGNEFLGTKGRMLLTKRGKVEIYNEKDERVEVEMPDVKSAGIKPHQQNFVDAIRHGAQLNADAMTGHLSASLPHIANLACRAGRGFRFDPASEQVIGDDELNSMLGRTYRKHWGQPSSK